MSSTTRVLVKFITIFLYASMFANMFEKRIYKCYITGSSNMIHVKCLVEKLHYSCDFIVDTI